MVSFRTALISLVALLLVAAAPASAGNGRFAAGQKLGMSFPQSIAVADFNGDGRADVAAPSVNESLIHLHLAKPGGGFERAPDVTTGLSPVGLVAADFNGDGNEDLAATSPDAPDIAFSTGPYSIAVGDFNADGKDDLAVGTYAPTGGTVYVELGAGDGTFTESDSAPNLSAAALAVGDLDGDGIEDLAFTRLGSGPPGILQGVGAGELQTATDLTNVAGTARGVAVGDLNGDRREDLVFTIRDKGIVTIVDKASTSSDPHDLPVGKDPYAVAVGDFNADGSEDIATTNLTDKTVSVLVNRHDDGGTFARRSIATGTNPVDVAVGNLAGDANDDLAVTSAAGDGGIEIKRGLGTPPLAGNLLKNGGFEGAGAFAGPAQFPPIPGWQRTGGMTFARYGIPSQAYFPTWVKAARHGAAGAGLLWGGNGSATNGVTTASQTVDVAGRAKHIDAGHARARLSAHLGGALGFDDAMTARAEFLGKGGAVLRALTIGPVTPADRRGLTSLLRRAGASQLPSGTRRIRVRLTSVDVDKSYSSAVADNVKLTLDARAAFRGNPLLAFTGLSSQRPGDPARVSVASGEPFRVTGELRARTVKRLGPEKKQLSLGKAALKIPAGGARTAKFALPPAARAELKKQHLLDLRLTAVVKDAAGHTRTVGATVRVEQAA